jgi:thioredoxin 1
MKNTPHIGIVGLVLLFCALQAGAEATKEGPAMVPVKDMVTMVDLGAKKCIPCKMMAPILEKLEKDYRGKAAIVFIDVFEDRSQVERFGIRAIPTQIFFDKTGKEVYRHVGFMAEDAIVKQLEKMGVNRPSAKKG